MIIRLILALFLMLVYFSPVHASNDGWNTHAKQKQIRKLLKSGTFKCGKECTHTVVGEYIVKRPLATNRIIVTTSANPKNDCHACAPELSFFYFEKQGNTWSITQQQIAAIQRGVWGVFNSDQIKVKAIAPELIGLFVETEFTGQGYTLSNLEIFSLQKSKLVNLLKICSAADNSGVFEKGSPEYYEWETSYEMQDGVNGAEDILIQLTDRVTGKKTSSLFRFNGKRYVSNNADTRIIDKDSGCGSDDS